MNPFPTHLRRSLFHLLVGVLFGLPVAGMAQESGDARQNAAAQPQSAQNEAAAENTGNSNINLPRLELTPKILYQLLLAEIAGRRGSVPLASSLYTDLAKSTRDPRIAHRAAEFALFARQPEAAIEVARIWVETEPESAQGRQMMAALLLATNRLDEAKPHLAKMLAIELTRPDATESNTNKASVARKALPDGPGEGLDHLYRLLSRHTDKAVVLQLIEELTAPYEKLAETHFTRARAAIDAKDEARALASLEQALRLRPDWEESVLFKAQLQRQTDSAQAEETLRNFVADHPGANEARGAYARILVGGKRYEEARREFATLLASQPANGEVLFAISLLSLQLNDIGPAEKYLKRLLEVGHGDANMARFYLGQIAEDTKRPAEALQWYLQVSAGDQYLPALSHAVSLLAKDGRIDEGRQLLQKAASANPKENIPLLIAEAQLLAGVGRNIEAFDLLDRSLASQPEQPQLLYESALLADKLNRLDVMERNLRKLIVLKPDDAHAYNALGYSLADHGVRLDEAQQLIDKGLSLAPNDAFILDSKGWLLYRRGQPGAAIEFLQKAFGLRQDPEIAAHLGEVLWTMNRRDEALKMWSDSAKSNPTNQLLADTIKKFKP